MPRPPSAESILKNLKKKEIISTPTGEQIYLPNHSGDHSKGRVLTTATTDFEIANKKYVDDNAGGAAVNTIKEDGTQIGGADIGTLDFLGADFDLTESPDKEVNIVINDAGIDHDATTNFVADEHVAHSTIDITAGVGLSGGGTIDANRTLTVDLNELGTEITIASGDFIAMVDITDNGSQKITFANIESSLNHDSLSGFVADEHVAHAGVSITAGVGLSGGGAIDVTRTLTVDLNELTTETAIAAADFVAMVDDTDSGSGKITFSNFESTLNHDSLAGFVSGEHFLQSAITTTGTITTGTWQGTTIALNQGGTGQTTATPAFDALAPTTTKADIIVHNGTDNIRLGVGSNTQVLTADSAQASGIKWAAGGSGGLLTYTEVTGTTQQMDVDNGYIANNSSLVTLTLPATAAVGSVVSVVGSGAGGWSIAQNAGDIIHKSDQSTTTGTGGSAASSKQWNSVQLVCIVADNEWVLYGDNAGVTFN